MKKNDRFNELENAVLLAMLDGPDEILAVLRGQYESAKLKGREKSEGGLATRFEVPEGVKRLPPDSTFTIEDVEAEVEGLENGVGFELFIEKGVMDRLEAFTYEEAWPEQLGKFSLYYHGGEERNFDSLRLRWTK
jgi:hypothetical protein